MPVVPFSAAPGRVKAEERRRPIEVPEADAPWVLMAAAAMDAQGRLTTTQPKDAIDE